MKVTNKGAGSRGVWSKTGLVMIDPGKSADVDLAPGDHRADDLEFAGNPVIPSPKDEQKAETSAGGTKALTKRAEDAEAALEAARDELGALKRSVPVVAAAVAQLDPENDDHWTAGGEPKVEAVKAIVGTDISRADIEGAAPDHNREAAKASAAA